MIKPINTNPLSDCALDHRPDSDIPRQKYRATQVSILRKHAHCEGFSLHTPLEEIVDYIAKEIDVYADDDFIESVAQDLAKIRIENANFHHRKLDISKDNA